MNLLYKKITKGRQIEDDQYFENRSGGGDSSLCEIGRFPAYLVKQRVQSPALADLGAVVYLVFVWRVGALDGWLCLWLN